MPHFCILSHIFTCRGVREVRARTSVQYDAECHPLSLNCSLRVLSSFCIFNTRSNMLSRKPVPSRNPESASTAPYPASPTAPSAIDGHASAYQPAHGNDLSLHRTRSSSASSHNTWNSGFSSDHDNDDNDQPKPESNDIPASLRVGRSQPSIPAQQSFQSHNPYHNLHNQSQTQTQPPPYPSEDSQSIWSSAPAQPTTAPPLPPSHPPPSLPPAPTFAALSLDDHVQQNSNTESLGPPPPVIPQKSSRRSLVLSLIHI